MKASDGNLERRNLPDGGAMVAVVLPLSEGTPGPARPLPGNEEAEDR